MINPQRENDDFPSFEEFEAIIGENPELLEQVFQFFDEHPEAQSEFFHTVLRQDPNAEDYDASEVADELTVLLHPELVDLIDDPDAPLSDLASPNEPSEAAHIRVHSAILKDYLGSVQRMKVLDNLFTYAEKHIEEPIDAFHAGLHVLMNISIHLVWGTVASAPDKPAWQRKKGSEAVKSSDAHLQLILKGRVNRLPKDLLLLMHPAQSDDS